MSTKFPLTEFFQASGNAAAVFSETLRDEVVTFACELWANYPAFITKSTLPGTSMARGFMNQMCSPIQPPVPFPAPPFTGGQCPGVIYNAYANAIVAADNSFLGLTRGQIVEIRFNNDLTGAVTQIAPEPFNEFSDVFADITDFNGVTNSQAVWDNPGGGFQVVGWLTDQAGDISSGTVWVTTVNPSIVRRKDGMPDTCGDPPTNYPPATPTINDLTKVVNITNLDGTVNIINLRYNTYSTNYNFPINIKVNGVNTLIDLSGLTIFGSPQVTTPNGTDTAPVPGSDGGDDGIGGNNPEEYPDFGWPVAPDFLVPESVQELVEYVVCTDGVITPIADTIKIVGSNIPFINILVDILVNILTDVCELSSVEPTVGLPEYYGLKPGVTRPAIVYLYKEFNGTTWGNSTYSSTVQNPTLAAISDIMTVVVPDKTMGTFVHSLSLTDGSNIRASGDTEASSLATFNFLLNQVEPSFIPVNVNDCIVVSEYPKLQVKTVKCRQIEYYPTGKAAGINPTTRRVIQAP